MNSLRRSSLALVGAVPAVDRESTGPLVPAGRPSERRAHVRVRPDDLRVPLAARLRYGASMTILDVSAGGLLVETETALRPDSNMAVELVGPDSRDAQIAAQVLRCEVSTLRGGLRYRAAFAFKRTFDHPALAVPPEPLLQTAPGDFLRPEFALKTIVDGFRRQAPGGRGAGPWRDPSAVIDALERLRAASARRADRADRAMGELLEAVVPALQRSEPPADVARHIEEALRRHLPLLAIGSAVPLDPNQAEDRELVTFSVWNDDGSGGDAVTAHFPSGFGLDGAQFRLLKAGAYLIGLAERWQLPPAEPAAPPPAAADAAAPDDMPVGWQRIVIRFTDGKLLRGYSNDFHPERAHLHLSPSRESPASERLVVPLSQLKAVFIVRDLYGNAERPKRNEFDHEPRARKVQVTFLDGEVIVGSTLSYKPDGGGFFMTPADTRGNNVRVYVVRSAVRHIRFV
jgi:hypothetical protein